jgi:acetyl-CoA carboxylase biotin carboxyl carrier protein
MDIRKVKKLIELMEESDLTEIEVKEGDDSVRISRQGVLPAAHVQMPAVQGAEANTVASPIDEPGSTQGQIVTAPMVGTFYRAPSPGSPSFVDVGDRVKAGDVLCIIESMKMMNQIKSDFSGTVEAVLVDNESAVEFDQALFTIIE